MTTRINGGIITDQMLSGSFRYFKMTGPAGSFAHTVGQGTFTSPTTIIPGQTIAGDSDGNPTPTEQVTFEKYVGAGQPVPNSIADRAFRVITEKCTVLLISLISDTEIHFVVEGNSCGWVDAAGIDAAIGALGTVGDGAIEPNGVDPLIPNATPGGAAPYAMTAITVTEVLTPVFTV